MSLEGMLGTSSFGKTVRDFVLVSLLSVFSSYSALANQDDKVTTLPKAAKAHGFELSETHTGSQYLEIPSIKLIGYNADLRDTPEVGYFTRLDFNKKTQMLTIETSEGEKATIKIDSEANTFSYENTLDGEVTESRKGSLVKDGRSKNFLFRRDHSSPHTVFVEYSDAPNSVTFKDSAGSVIYQEDFHMPKGFDLKVIDDKYLLVSDTIGGNFMSRHAPWRRSERKYIAFAISWATSSYEDGDLDFMYDLPGTLGLSDSFQGGLFNIVRNYLNANEWSEEKKVPYGGVSYEGWGPDRNGDLKLWSYENGNTVIYDVSSGIFSLGSGWEGIEEGSRIVKQDPENGILTVVVESTVFSTTYELKLRPNSNHEAYTQTIISKESRHQK